MASTPIKLVYFEFRGRGELIRNILTVAGVDFIDERIEFADWPKLKHATPSPNKMLPYMEIDGKVYAESLALARYLAKKYGFSGKDDLESLSIDMFFRMVEDVRDLMYSVLHITVLTEEQKKSMTETFAKEQAPAVYAIFEKTISENASGYLVGDKLTVADLALADVNDQVEKTAPGFHDKFPKVKEHWENIKALPKLAEYLAKRKDTWC